MQTIYLDGRDYNDSADVHQALKLLLDLPDYYGGNADALYDCLSERREPVSLYIAHMGNASAADALSKAALVMEDLGGRVRKPDGEEA